jgi:hypothetical protein
LNNYEDVVTIIDLSLGMDGHTIVYRVRYRILMKSDEWIAETSPRIMGLYDANPKSMSFHLPLYK